MKSKRSTQSNRSARRSGESIKSGCSPTIKDRILYYRDEYRAGTLSVKEIAKLCKTSSAYVSQSLCFGMIQPKETSIESERLRRESSEPTPLEKFWHMKMLSRWRMPEKTTYELWIENKRQ